MDGQFQRITKGVIALDARTFIQMLAARECRSITESHIKIKSFRSTSNGGTANYHHFPGQVVSNVLYDLTLKGERK